ncbi:hypothetical protein DV736_g2616, partial [Chaetothyriales sp. CBS 134916]
MVRVNVVAQVNSFETPPSSILVTRVVNGDQSTVFDQASFNQLLQESLGSDENGQPNLGSDIVINHKLINIIIKAGIDPFIDESKANPFRSKSASATDEAQFLSCLDVIRIAISRAPEVIYIQNVSENETQVEKQVPLYTWLLPKLLAQVTPKCSQARKEAILGIAKTVLDADTSPVSDVRGQTVARFLLRCASALVDHVRDRPDCALFDTLTNEDSTFAAHSGDQDSAVEAIAQFFPSVLVGHVLFSVSVLLGLLIEYAKFTSLRLYFRDVLNRLGTVTEDFSEENHQDTMLGAITDQVQHLTLRAKAPKHIVNPLGAEATQSQEGDRARKRPRLSNNHDTTPVQDDLQSKHIRTLTGALCGTAVADLDGLSTTAASCFKRLSEQQQYDAIALLGTTVCRLSGCSNDSSLCAACDGGSVKNPSTTVYAEELMKTLLALVPAINRTSRIRVKAMTALRQILLHSACLDDLRLSQSTAGKWCLQSLRSSSRDLRTAAIGTLQVYTIHQRQDASLTRDNRAVALDFLQNLWTKGDASLQETAVVALVRVAQVVGDEELNLIILRLVDYLGHNNSYLSGLVYSEIQQLAQAFQISPTVLCRPFWRTLGLVVARSMEKESPGIDQLCDLLGMRVSGLRLLVEEYALPYLVLHRRLNIIEQFAATHGSSTSSFDICTSPRNLASILSFLLAQGFQDAEQKIMNLLLDVSTDFNSEDLAGWLAHVPIEVTCFSLKSIGDTGEGKSSRVYQALQLVAQLDSRKPGIHSSSKRNEVMGSFLENNALGIVSHFTVSLNDLEAKEPKLEKRRSIIALGEVAKIGKSRILGALPQICACLRNALEDRDLCDAAFSAWAMVMSSLRADDLDTLVDQTFAIVVKHWGKFNTITQQRAYDLIAELLEKHSDWIRESFTTLPSLASIPVMAKFEVEISALKRQMDERHQLMAFLSRLEDENEIVVEQALTELVPVLHLKQDLLHRSISLEQPDELVSDLTRALLDSCVRFQANHEISRLCARCLGCIGCLDANKIETTVERKSIVVSSNFGKAEETVNFILFFLEHVLVNAFLSASTTRAQGFLGWAMQQLLKLCQDEDLSGPRIRTGPSTGSRRWHDLPEAVRNTLIPFRTSKYRVQDVRSLENQTYPYFKPGLRHKDWLRGIVMDFLNRAPGDNQKLVFGICSRIIQGQDPSIPAFLLPFAVLNLIISGVHQDVQDIVSEFISILQQPFDNQDRKTQEDISLCSQTIFEVLDYLQRWLQGRKKHYSSHLGRPERGISELVLENTLSEIRNVEAVLEQIPPDVLSRRAIDCKSYARALFHWEQYMRRPNASGSKDEELARLQDIYAQIDEPDGIEGISAQMHIVDIQGRVLEHKKVGRWTAVQGWYQVQLAEHPDDMDLQKNLMECLKESGQHDSLLDRYQAMGSVSVAATAQLKSYAVEAAWTTMRWAELDSLLESGGDDDFTMHLGRMFSLLNKGEGDKIEVLLEEMFKSTASELTPNSITTLQNCHETLFRLHILEDVRLLKDADPNDRPSCLSVIGKRLEVIGSNVRDKQIALSVQRAVMFLRKNVFQNNDIASSWLQSARLARKARDSAQAFDAVVKASALGDKSAAIEEAKLFWQDGEHRKAIQTLEGAIDSGAFVAHDYVAEDANAPLTTEQQKNQNEMTAKAYLLLGKWLDQAGQTQSDVIKHTFRKSTENFRRWEKGWYYLGRHYNKLLDSERAMPLDKQSQTYLSGEMTKLVIENYLRSLINGTKYVFQTLPKILTLWFELVANLEPPPDPRKGSDKFQLHNAAQRKRVVEETNNYIKKYIDRIQASVLYTILPQIVARICHTNQSVYEILTNIVVKVVRAFPNQALWALLAVIQSQSKDRASRGREIVTKIVDAPKKSSGLAMPTADLRALIYSSQRFSDELLRVSEFPIEGKVSHVSLTRKLGFNSKIAPSKLVVPSENSLIPSIPTSYDSAYLKSFRAFPKEPITITEILDEALVLASLQKPRKLSIRGSDGQIYGVLAKPKDDMRKDQRLMEFNTMINRFLKRDVEASKRRLYIRTYAVIPLNEECGLIEWVNNLKTFRDIILKLYKDKSITPNYGEIRRLLDDSCSGPPEKESIFTTSVLKIFPPVFHEWFVESFPEPTAWFNARLCYTRACAVMSIVGHVLGLGDRHGENILFEEDNGSLMHVDFNCLFDKGLTFEKPEYVPFRLTHNMVDAMGAYGYEGPFRRSSEITLQLLRSNEDALMTILETFMHDPTTDFLEKERRKKKAVPGVPNTPLEVLEGVRGKVRGFLAGESVPLSVGGYVEEMINRAVDEHNLCRMYIGWCAFF